MLKSSNFGIFGQFLDVVGQHSPVEGDPVSPGLQVDQVSWAEH